MLTRNADPSRRQRMQPEERRTALIAAMIETLAHDGAKGATLRQTCKRADVAPGLVSHFFGGWHGLLMASYDALTGAFTHEVSKIRSTDGLSPYQQLDRLVALFFADSWTSTDQGDAYVALWALSRTEVDLQERMSRHHEELLGHVSAILADVTADPKSVADELLLQLNGIWMEMILNPAHLNASHARSLAAKWTDRLITDNALPSPERIAR